MAVPKRKTSPSRAGKRRSHIKNLAKNIIEDKKSGEYRLSHHLDLKTGFYKGEPFYGTLEDRQNITNEFIMHLQDLLPKEKIVGPPEEWYRMDPEKYAKTYMELSSSFHIAPLYYRSENWGINEFFV